MTTDSIKYMLKKLFIKLLIPVTILSSVIYVIWRALFTIPFEYGIIAVIFSLSLLAVEILGIFEAAIHLHSMGEIVSPPKPDVDESLFPDVDIFIATYNEPAELLYKTINGCVHMDYPDKSKVHIYICDDGKRQEMKELAEKMNVHHVTRLEHKHAKAGNLNNAMTVSGSPLIVTLDADMIPMSDFLMSCVPYFLTGEKIGFVQTPQAFYNFDLFQYYLYSENRIPNEQDYFYKTIQVSRNKTNTVIYGGSNTILSRQALDEIGGFVTNVITEDFATGMAIQSNGYKCIAIDNVHASGLSPGDLKSLIKQRERWARGCIQTGRQLNILSRKGLRLEQKLIYMSSITYWYSSLKRLVYILSPIAFSVFGIVVVQCTLSELILFWLPMHLLNRMSIKRFSCNIRTPKWSNVYENILFPALLPVVLLETFGLSQKKFAVTRKDGVIEDDRRYQIKQALPHIIFGIFSVIGIYNCITNKFITGSMGYIVILYWLLINSYNILLSIFFMLGRRVDRAYERVKVALDCTVSAEGKSFHCITNDISEKGISFILDQPKYLPPDQAIDIKLSSEKYLAGFTCNITHVVNTKKGYRYSFQITAIEEYDYSQLLQLIYDRVPTTVKNLNEDVSSFDDIRLNLIKRGADHHVNKRKLPRIDVGREFQTLEDNIVKLVNFSYEYLTIEPKPTETLLAFTLPIGHQMNLECAFEKEVSGGVLYKITNFKQIVKNPLLDSVIKSWRIEKEEQYQERWLGRKNEFGTDEFDEMVYL